MKVLLINGSAREKGCTYTALSHVASTLEEEQIKTEIYQIGKKPIGGCISCMKCVETGNCVFDDKVNEVREKAKEIDGFIFGTPVYYGSANSSLISFMTRLFFPDLVTGGNTFALKPAACVISARRAGTSATFDVLNKFFTVSQMPVISSQYWNMVHGNRPEEVLQDLEGLQIMRVLARNMAWFLKCKEAGQRAGVAMPIKEEHLVTSFINGNHGMTSEEMLKSYSKK
nr:flavodoxin family protein [Clostridioides difficile]